MRKVALIIAITACCVFAREPAPSPSDYTLDLSKYGFIDTSLNKIQFPKGNKSFEPFFNKLDTLVFENRGQVRILHIGGSHIQADAMSGRIREHLVKEYPGASAGRGFVFPFSAAKTNTPSSYGSTYKGIWDMSKNVLREVKKPLGLLGIAVSTSDPRAEFSILLNRYNPQPIWSETRIRLFGYSDNGDVIPVLHVDSLEIPGKLDSATQSFTFPIPRPIDSIHISFRWLDNLQQAEIARFITDSLRQDSIARAAALADSLAKDSLARKDSSKKPAAIPDNVALPLDSMYQDSSVIDTALDEPPPFEPEPLAPLDVSSNDSKPGRPRFTLTGIYTESDAPGIMYANVGINGAKVPNYFEATCPLLEKELAFLKPDLVIFAIGINDANVDRFDDKGFRANYDTLITRIHKVSPNAAIIFETNNDSFRMTKRKRYVQHPNGEVARKSFFILADKYKAGVWDKFSIMGGLGSMAKWEKANLAKKDKVHFKLSGYNLLGDLFYKAIIQAYQDHIANLPALEPEAPKPAPKKADSTKVPPKTKK